MATNPYFKSTYQGELEQNLVSGLMKECIRQQGYDIFYMPREIVNLDYLFGEDTHSKFTEAICLEAYIKTVTGYGGGGEIISKFGIDVQDDMTLQIHQERFFEEISTRFQDIIRPREGDLIYFGLDRHSIFEISFVEEKVPFFQLGQTYLFELSLKRLVHSGEQIQTQYDEIDTLIEYEEETRLEDNAPIDDESTDLIDRYEKNPLVDF